MYGYQWIVAERDDHIQAAQLIPDCPAGNKGVQFARISPLAVQECSKSNDFATIKSNKPP